MGAWRLRCTDTDVNSQSGATNFTQDVKNEATSGMRRVLLRMAVTPPRLQAQTVTALESP